MWQIVLPKNGHNISIPQGSSRTLPLFHQEVVSKFPPLDPEQVEPEWGFVTVSTTRVWQSDAPGLLKVSDKDDHTHTHKHTLILEAQPPCCEQRSMGIRRSHFAASQHQFVLCRSEPSSAEGLGNPVQYSCLENPIHGQRSLAGYSPQGPTESDTTEVTSCLKNGQSAFGRATLESFPCQILPKSHCKINNCCCFKTLSFEWFVRQHQDN